LATGGARRADPREACEALRRLAEEDFEAVFLEAVFLDLDR
jgi:hypothetical protein